MRFKLTDSLSILTVQLIFITSSFAFSSSSSQRHIPESNTPSPNSISVSFFATLERLSRLVDIAYCIGTTGVRKPFDCVSRCNDFPSLSLINTWNTGPLLSDSCGYIAVDHGVKQRVNGDVLNAGEPAIVVAFRGTYSIANTVVDLSTVPQEYVPYPSPDHGGGEPPEEPEHKCTNCTVHMGFLQSWKNTRRLVLPQLRQLRLQYPSYPIQLVGHSLGGSVACLAALELKVSLGWEDVIVTTFGEPRVGNEGLARFVDEVFHLDGQENLEKREYRRVTHKEDPVPLLPLGEWGYKSHSGEVYIAKQELTPSESDIYMCIGDEDPKCIAGADDSLWMTIRRLFHAKSLLTTSDKLAELNGFPSRFKLWQLLFAHRDYFWRLGLCVPGGDPADWGRGRYQGPGPETEEL
ncbi:uncharacterized protein FIESC28_02369 [Fusarium coffeatum]|uniref:Fungal lipase-type domain-containing protein n=1 Tax=Fusarium coffeatum TaxID=231269 RepID=A0A366S643_9HYPO|nr:uncharacterized protein FIESC28_02369 [Fusarium coffeatum]RBR24801.1 hypothetical protein FIESC28_02369 [Fusarium coffeatum]